MGGPLASVALIHGSTCSFLLPVWHERLSQIVSGEDMPRYITWCALCTNEAIRGRPGFCSSGCCSKTRGSLVYRIHTLIIAIIKERDQAAGML